VILLYTRPRGRGSVRGARSTALMGQVDLSGQVFRTRNSCRSAARSSRRITIDPYAAFLVAISRHCCRRRSYNNYSQITRYRVGYSCRGPCNIITVFIYTRRLRQSRTVLHRKRRPQACVSR